MINNKTLRIAATVLASFILLICCGVAVISPDWAIRLAAAPSATQMVDEFEAVSGPHPGFRRNHAKGVCVSGHFESNGNAAPFSKAALFKPGSYPVIGRLSIVGGDPAVNDARGNLRSLALLMVADGQVWKTSMNSIPVFPVRTPEVLLKQLQASVPDKATGRPDPSRVQAFREQHPETQGFRDWLTVTPPSSGYDNGTYYSVNAFRFLDEQGQASTVRWSMEPEAMYAPQVHESSGGSDPDRLSFSLAKRLQQAPVRWHLVITFAEPGDPSNDATRLWPTDRRRIDAGVLVITSHQSQVDGPCRDVDFNPLVLPPGIEPSDDPLLMARAAAYAESRNRRLHESRTQ
ncbi:catalase [Pseudomonas reinekei]|jgi:catalase|uniref:Catalase-related peroxidase n=1 Tax=Pseudomonas reinekei TaxID=395598 RepID=A0A1H0I451_PSERE|nr:catalase family peroxidase [Pseudomonas reinekei]KAB0486890.1 catalase family peroxidase [Pseudomonas reinekei]OLU04116.1 catalase [Pseudomonas reinekei]SDO26199.1 catalase [Pseudomonas reinekei]